MPTPNVFDLYRMSFKKALSHYYNGQTSFNDLLFDSGITNAKQLRQMLHNVSAQPDDIDKDGIIILYDINTLPKYKSHIHKICAEASLRCDIKDFIETVLL